MTRPTALALAGALVALTSLAGCSSEGESGGPAAHASASTSHTATPTEPAFNPCDGVDAAAVSRALGSPLRLSTGTAEAPRCSLLPVHKGGPTFALSYLWFDQGLDAAWRTMQVPAGTVSRPAVAGADDARLVVNESGSAYAVTAFLQNGTLIQTVNALALPPYDGPKVLRAVRVLLQQLSAGGAQASR